MNNEEKAKELYRKYRETDFARESAAFNAAMDMAEWKDEQLKNFLKDRYNKNLGSIKSWEVESIYRDLFNEPISENIQNF